MKSRVELTLRLRLFICIFKIDPIETVELMFNFDEKQEKICNQHLVIGELLKNFVLYDNWYFVPLFNIENFVAKADFEKE